MDAKVVSGDDLSPDYDIGSLQRLTLTPDGKLRVVAGNASALSEGAVAPATPDGGAIILIADDTPGAISGVADGKNVAQRGTTRGEAWAAVNIKQIGDTDVLSQDTPVPVIVSAGITASATFTPAAAAYGAGDIMDVAKQFAFTLANGDPVPDGSLIRILSSTTKIDVTAVPSGQTSYTARAYSSTPPSAQADNDLWTLVSGDLSVYKGPISLGTPVDEGSCLYIKNQYIDTDIKLTGTSLWLELVTEGAHTAAAVARTVTLNAMVL